MFSQCPKCNKKFEIEPIMIDQQFECPFCKEKITILPVDESQNNSISNTIQTISPNKEDENITNSNITNKNYNKQVKNNNKSDNLLKLYSVARNAFEAENYEVATRYYDEILLKDNSSWEATFYSVFCRCQKCKIGEIPETLLKMSKCIPLTIKFLYDQEEDINPNVLKIKSDLFLFSTMLIKNAGSFSEDNHYNHNTSVWTYWVETICYYVELFFVFGDELEARGACETDLKNIVVDVWTITIDLSLDWMSKIIGSCQLLNDTRSEIERHIEIVKKYEPDYKPKSTGRRQGCYIATAIYGSYDCPPVWVLRRYRDKVLTRSIFGRLFVQVYYLISPKFVYYFGNNALLKQLGRKCLDAFVRKLNKDGINDKPYQDMNI